MPQPAVDTKNIPEGKKQIVKNLFMSDIAEEFIALQLDIEIPIVIAILKELGAYQPGDAVA